MAIPFCFCTVFHLNTMWRGVHSYLIYIRWMSIFDFTFLARVLRMRGLFILICHLWYMNPFCYYLKHIIMDDRCLATWLHRFCMSGILSRCEESNKIAFDIFATKGISRSSRWIGGGKKRGITEIWIISVRDNKRLISTRKKQYQSRDIPTPVKEGASGDLIKAG